VDAAVPSGEHREPAWNYGALALSKARQTTTVLDNLDLFPRTPCVVSPGTIQASPGHHRSRPVNPKTDVCIRCHPRDPEAPVPTGNAHFICDRCMDDLNHCRLPTSSPTQTVPPQQPGERKSKRKTNRKRAVVATALVGMLLLFTGCTLHRTVTLDVDLNPTLLPRPQLPDIEISPAPPGPRPTES
jgi:hypothetical protein